MKRVGREHPAIVADVPGIEQSAPATARYTSARCNRERADTP